MPTSAENPKLIRISTMLLLNNQRIDYSYFSGGEISVTLPPDIREERVKLVWKPEDPQSIIHLMMTVNALQEAGIKDIDLDVLYLPYARQDRVCHTGEAFGLKVICKILNNLEVSTLRLWDVHNHDATQEYLNSWVWHWEANDVFIRHHIFQDFDMSNLILCAPDKGARDRVDLIVKTFDLGTPVYLDKTRNPETGAIESVGISDKARAPAYVEGYNVMVIDDICDGGATFIKAAIALRAAKAANLYLYVTHGIFRHGLEDLLQYYSHIYCHHVLDDAHFQSTDRLTILAEFPHVS